MEFFNDLVELIPQERYAEAAFKTAVFAIKTANYVHEVKTGIKNERLVLN